MHPLPDDPPPPESLFAGRRPVLRGATLENLDKIVENSSEKNRNFFIAYLGLLVYVQAIVFATTDLKLLVDTEGLKLPIIDLNVPLVGFYVVVPIFVIALHFNFLQNLESHHYKLMRWQEAHPDGIVPRSRIQPFLFDYATLETGSQMERWGRWANSLLVLNLAPITLGLLLWRYTDRQEVWVTVWHYLAFLFDSYLVWKLRVALRLNREAGTFEPRLKGWRRWPSTVSTSVRFFRDVPKSGLRGGFGLFLLAETVFTIAVSALPSEAFVNYCLPLARKLEAFQRETPLLGIASLLLPRIAIDPGEAVWKPDQKALELEAKMAGESDWVKYFNEQGMGFRPSTSHLRLAILNSQRLPRAQLQEARLESARLQTAQLQGADLGSAQLQGADLWSAQLQGANLQRAALQGAGLGEVSLQGANLKLAHIREANLRSAQLQGADLQSAQLQSSHLDGAQLQGANLQSAQLQHAELEEAQLQGACLQYALLPRADLSRAELQGAYLRFAQLQGAYLVDAQLQGADLDHTELQGSELTDAQLQGAILGFTSLEGAGPPAASTVFKLAPTFDTKQVDWTALEKMGIWIAEARRGREAEATLKHDPEAIYRDVLPTLCEGTKVPKESRLAAVRGIRRNYGAFQIVFWDNRSELETTATAIDRTLCTLPACADLKGDIEGLDCSRFAEAKQQPSKSKPPKTFRASQ